MQADEASPEFQTYVESVLNRVSLSGSARSEWFDELMAHGEFAPPGETPDLISSFGPPELFAERIRLAEAETSFIRDPACVRAVVRTFGIAAAGWLAIQFIRVVAAVSSWPAVGSAAEAVFWILPVASGCGGYLLLKQGGGNPHRVIPFLHAAIVIFAATLLLRFQPHVIAPLPDPALHLFLESRIPMPDFTAGGMRLLTTVVDLDYTGGYPDCIPGSFISTMETPVQGLSSLRFSAMFAVTWIATVFLLRRGHRAEQ